MLLMRVVEYFVYTSHFASFVSSSSCPFFSLTLFCYIRMLFTTYFDFYDFYSSLSHTHSVSAVFFLVKMVQLEIDIEFICNRMCQCHLDLRDGIMVSEGVTIVFVLLLRHRNMASAFICKHKKYLGFKLKRVEKNYFLK